MYLDGLKELFIAVGVGVCCVNLLPDDPGPVHTDAIDTPEDLEESDDVA